MNPHAELTKLTSLFPDEGPLIARAEHVPAALVPEPYKQMLAHDQHMTVTMESYHRSPVSVEVIAKASDGNVYSRKILLHKTDGGNVVQFGIVRFDLSYVTPPVRDEILREQTPLGRVLIKHNVLRHIDLGAILRIAPGPELQRYFHCAPEHITYGRLATIFCNEQPAVDLLEITAPLD